MKKNYRKRYNRKKGKNYIPKSYIEMKNTRGITLIALVITVIVLLILARCIAKHGI